MYMMVSILRQSLIVTGFTVIVLHTIISPYYNVLKPLVTVSMETKLYYHDSVKCWTTCVCVQSFMITHMQWFKGNIRT